MRSEKLGQVADEFDAAHSIERARARGLGAPAIVPAARLRPYLVDAVRRGMERTLAAPPRRRMTSHSFGTGWRFGPGIGRQRPAGVDDSGFAEVTLPHTVVPRRRASHPALGDAYRAYPGPLRC